MSSIRDEIQREKRRKQLFMQTEHLTKQLADVGDKIKDRFKQLIKNQKEILSK